MNDAIDHARKSVGVEVTLVHVSLEYSARIFSRDVVCLINVSIKCPHDPLWRVHPATDRVADAISNAVPGVVDVFQCEQVGEHVLTSAGTIRLHERVREPA